MNYVYHIKLNSNVNKIPEFIGMVKLSSKYFLENDSNSEIEAITNDIIKNIKFDSNLEILNPI